MFLVASGTDVIIDKKVGSGFKECEWMNVLNLGFEKFKVMLRKPRACLVVEKSEHIDQIKIAIMLLINTRVMPFPIIPCGNMVTC